MEEEEVAEGGEVQEVEAEVVDGVFQEHLVQGHLGDLLLVEVQRDIIVTEAESTTTTVMEVLT